MHSAKNMVGARPANYDKPLWKRYFHVSRHTSLGVRIKKAYVAFKVAMELKALVKAYA